MEASKWQAFDDYNESVTGDETRTLRVDSPWDLIFSVEASRDCAKTSPSPADDEDLQGSDQASSSSSPESLTLFSPMEDGSSLRTYPDFFPPTVDEISPSYSRRWPSSGFTTSPGECWTADTSECPKGGGAYLSLPDVLEADVHPRFYLSPRAAAGILRRAERRGRELPRPLMEALASLVDPTTTMPREGSSSQALSALAEAVAGEPMTSTGMEPTSREPLLPSGKREVVPLETRRTTSSVRRLTPTECERLQGFPDGHTVVP